MEQLQKRAEKQQEEDMKIQDEMNKPANMIDETLAKIGNNYMPTSRLINHLMIHVYIKNYLIY